ncbi:hypothetical protein JX265_000843 [Neoarthrinium moseri]|uniref:FAD-binding PCMH-type domain-containing protein n=1 Tax=Neoarthrinium moseri TaxID=1658444 RepID=A0A9P9WWK3_9PEZI|nr:hypothetical protein JX265_000843 [Neoarthrinium moseri]
MGNTQGIESTDQGDLPIVWRDSTDPETYYEAVWGRVFNVRRDTKRQPRAVVRVSKASHIKAAVDLANKENCRVSVRSGGHSWAAWSVRDDAILLDLGNFREISYNDDSKIVSCTTPTHGKELNEFLRTKGRLFAGGHCPDVGLGGFLLQGGMGWNCKNWGWSCEQIHSLDVVTADGEEIHCSANENADLYWAARGSGPGFPAVIVRYHLNTRPLLELYESVYIFPISEYRKVLQWVIDVCPTADEGTEIVGTSRYLEGEDEISMIAAFTSFKPNREEAEKALKPIHDSRPSNSKFEIYCGTTSLAQQYVNQGEANPKNHRYCAENAYIENDADVPAALEKAFTTLPSKKAFSLYFSMNPTSRRPLPDMALSMQTDHYFAIYTVWENEADDERCTNWVRSTMREMKKHDTGSYMGDADFQVRGTKFWSQENGKKLMEIRRKRDPKGRICGYLDSGDKSGIKGLANDFDKDETNGPDSLAPQLETLAV